MGLTAEDAGSPTPGHLETTNGDNHFGDSSDTTARNSTFNNNHHGNLDAVSTTEPPALYNQHTVRRRLGLHGKTPIDEEHAVAPHMQLLWPRIRAVLREPLAEFWGVFFMILFGNGSVAQVLLSQAPDTVTGAPGRDGFGNYQSISWGWGLGVMLGIYIGGEYVLLVSTLSHLPFTDSAFRPDHIFRPALY